MEEIRAYWSQAQKVDQQQHGRRVLATWRMPAASERGRFGFAQCWVSRDDGGTRPVTEGVFTLRWDDGEAKSWSGHLLKTTDDLYLFGPRPVAPSADWPQLVAAVKALLEYQYQFPPELGVEYRNQDITGWLRRSRERGPT